MSFKPMPLFPGEELRLSHRRDEDLFSLSDNQINEKYAKGDVRIVTEQARYPLSSMPTIFSSPDYKINPEFQRRHRWSTEKKSRLIESFIMNVPVPPIFLYEDRFSHYEVMDGLQRITAITDFYAGRFQLEGLTEWVELNGRTYQNLPEQLRRGIDRRHLSSIILLQETAKNEKEAQQLKQLVFERINSGGIKLEAQESRNAIYNGPMNELCIKLSRNKYLCKTWGIPEPSEQEQRTRAPSQDVLENALYQKMIDVELVLRFFAYRQRLQNQRGALSVYLDLYLQEANNFPQNTLRNLEVLFESTIKLAFSILGERAFWLLRLRGSQWNWFARPTTAVYDPLMFVLSQFAMTPDKLLARSVKIRESIGDFYQQHYSSFEGRYTNLSNIEDRNRLFGGFIASFI